MLYDKILRPKMRDNIAKSGKRTKQQELSIRLGRIINCNIMTQNT